MIKDTVTRLQFAVHTFGLHPALPYNTQVTGDVAELADAHDLESCAARRVGSSPSIPINKIEALPEQRFCFYLETIRSHTRATYYLASMLF
jgi:hypothetical protein